MNHAVDLITDFLSEPFKENIHFPLDPVREKQGTEAELAALAALQRMSNINWHYVNHESPPNYHEMGVQLQVTTDLQNAIKDWVDALQKIAWQDTKSYENMTLYGGQTLRHSAAVLQTIVELRYPQGQQYHMSREGKTPLNASWGGTMNEVTPTRESRVSCLQRLLNKTDMYYLTSEAPIQLPDPRYRTPIQLRRAQREREALEQELN